MTSSDHPWARESVSAEWNSGDARALRAAKADRRWLEEEAVRLVGTSGRTQRAAARDLGVGLSTLIRWIGRSRDRQSGDPGRPGQAGTAAKLKRLRRENEILRQERGILKRATAFFTREGSR